MSRTRTQTGANIPFSFPRRSCTDRVARRRPAAILPPPFASVAVFPPPRTPSNFPSRPPTARPSPISTDHSMSPPPRPGVNRTNTAPPLQPPPTVRLPSLPPSGLTHRRRCPATEKAMCVVVTRHWRSRRLWWQRQHHCPACPQRRRSGRAAIAMLSAFPEDSRLGMRAIVCSASLSTSRQAEGRLQVNREHDHGGRGATVRHFFTTPDLMPTFGHQNALVPVRNRSPGAGASACSLS